MAQYAVNEVDRFSMPISQCLMAKMPLAFTDISEVRSHVQALKQCEYFLKMVCVNARLIAEADTALCARDLAQGRFTAITAVIASELCAQAYGLLLLKTQAQDCSDNRTTFSVYEKRI